MTLLTLECRWIKEWSKRTFDITSIFLRIEIKITWTWNTLIRFFSSTIITEFVAFRTYITLFKIFIWTICLTSIFIQIESIITSLTLCWFYTITFRASSITFFTFLIGIIGIITSWAIFYTFTINWKISSRIATTTISF